MVGESAGATSVFVGDWASRAQEDLSFHQSQNLVNNAEAHERGRLVYDLDVKHSASARKIPDSTGVGSTAMQGQVHVAAAKQDVENLQRADDPNAKERDVWDPQAAPAPSDDAPLQRFQQGDKVMYWSDTYLQWMHAVVITAAEGGLVYDLDVKRGANGRKMKLDTTSGAGVPNVANQVVVATQAAAVQLEAPPQPTGSDAEPPLFQNGDKVMYWSDTYNQWMHAVVVQAHEGGQLYDLDVKRGANARKIKMADPNAQPAPQAAQQVGTAGGQGGQAAASPQRLVPMTSSPLSVRARATTVAGGLDNMPLPPGAPAPQATESSGNDDLMRATVQASATAAARFRIGEGQVSQMGGGLTSNSTRPRTPSSSALTGVPATGGAATPKAMLPLPVFSSDQPSAGETPARSGMAATQSATSPSPTAAQSTQQNGALRMGGASPGGYTSSASGNIVVGFSLPSSASNAVGGLAPTTGSGTPSAKYAGSTIQGTSPQAQTGVGRVSLFMGTGTESRRAQGGGATPSVNGGRTNAAQKVSLTSVGRAGGVSPARSSRWQSLEQGELQMGSDAFNPSQAGLRQQLTSKMGLPASSTIEEMQGFRGGLNEGVWYLSEPSQGAGVPREELVLKLVRCHRIATNILTEAENFLKLFRDFPGILNDKHVAFPVKIFSCHGLGGTKRHDLIVMRKVRGERLAELIARKWYGNQVPQLMQILEKLGVCLAEYHNRYGAASQHGDFQPSNIFYDEETDEITFIDVGGMGVPTMETDVEHFSKSMNLLAEAYGFQLAIDGIRVFEQGYNRVIEKRP
mmetsp:Transcript_73049/g.191507  ORF Transcript_73049/g.191507 Transcript_73049/m.191507 type:complete len:800 (-) Transcript_73049:100-2499(-)